MNRLTYRRMSFISCIMDQIEKILKGLQDTMTVMEGLERRNADRLKDHQLWLEDLNTAMLKHNAVWQRHEAAWQRADEAWQRHQEWLEAHDRANAEFDAKMDRLNEAITRFIQGRNGN